MKARTPLLMLECQDDYSILYFVIEGNDEPVVRAFFSSAPKDSVKEYYWKDDIALSEILHFFDQVYYTIAEDSEIELEALTEIFGGCKILAFIP